MSQQPNFIPLPDFQKFSSEEMLSRATAYYQNIRRRRTVREFSNQPFDRRIIEQCILAAGTAPSGANLQPWHFAVVESPEIKSKIREAAEIEEREFYHHKAPQEWLNALAPLGTDEYKPFLEIAPYLIVVFAKAYESLPDGRKVKHYYATESVGIATGLLINGLHDAGLATLTHTPSPMKFLNSILDRPSNERPFVLLVTGFPAADARVPDITKKSLEEITTFH